MNPYLFDPRGTHRLAAFDRLDDARLRGATRAAFGAVLRDLSERLAVRLGSWSRRRLVPRALPMLLRQAAAPHGRGATFAPAPLGCRPCACS